MFYSNILIIYLLTIVDICMNDLKKIHVSYYMNSAETLRYRVYDTNSSTIYIFFVNYYFYLI